MPRRGVRRREEREEARAAALHAAPVQARQRRLDGRPAAHLFVVPADGSAEAKQITDGDYEDAEPDLDAGRAAASRSPPRASEDWDIELIGDIYLVPADGGEPQRLTAGDSSHARAELLAGRLAARVQLGPGGFDFPRHTQIAVVDAGDGREPPDPDGVARPAVRARTRTMREPIWDGDSIVFASRGRAATSTSTASRRTAASRSSSPAARSSSPATTRATASSPAPARPRRT